MVDMEMGADDQVDRLRRKTGGGEAVDPPPATLMEDRPGARLAVPDAGVDQDDPPLAADHETLEGEDQPPRVRIVEARSEPSEVLRQVRRLRIRVDLEGIEHAGAGLLDPLQRGRADRDRSFVGLQPRNHVVVRTRITT